MSWLKEIRDVAIEGNSVDLSFGVIAGAASGVIVSSLVDVVCMPVSRLAFVELPAFNLPTPVSYPNGVAVASRPSAAELNTIGLFTNRVVKFLIAAFVSFLVVRGINTIGNRQAAAWPHNQQH
jgi:large conductance mechanosensitive channel